MKIQKNLRHPLATLAVAGLTTVSFSLGHFSVAHAQDAPPPPPAGERGAPLPPAGGPVPGPAPRGERPPTPPRPEDDPANAIPVDPQAAPAAVKTATDAAGAFAPGQVWIRTAPRGEQQVQATILFQNREVARLEFDPGNGALLARGQRLPVPPPAPGGPVPGPRGPGASPDAPAPDAAPPVTADRPANVRTPSAPLAPAPAPDTQVNLDQLKARLAETVKGLSVGQGAEIMGREGFWKVPLIYQNRVVGELHVSGDGSKMIQDFAAARDAAIFAR